MAPSRINLSPVCTRRDFLILAGLAGVSAVVAGCGDGTSSPNGSSSLEQEKTDVMTFEQLLGGSIFLQQVSRVGDTTIYAAREPGVYDNPGSLEMQRLTESFWAGQRSATDVILETNKMVVEALLFNSPVVYEADSGVILTSDSANTRVLVARKGGDGEKCVDHIKDGQNQDLEGIKNGEKGTNDHNLSLLLAFGAAMIGTSALAGSMLHPEAVQVGVTRARDAVANTNVDSLVFTFRVSAEEVSRYLAMYGKTLQSEKIATMLDTAKQEWVYWRYYLPDQLSRHGALPTAFIVSQVDKLLAGMKEFGHGSNERRVAQRLLENFLRRLMGSRQVQALKKCDKMISDLDKGVKEMAVDVGYVVGQDVTDACLAVGGQIYMSSPMEGYSPIAVVK